MLTNEQHRQATAICDEICEQLETHDEYTCTLNERRDPAADACDDVCALVVRMLQAVGYEASRAGAKILVQKARA